MTISIIRSYEVDDQARVKAAAERFCDRHNIKYDASIESEAEMSISYAIFDADPEDKRYLRKLWTACFCRALRVPYDVRTTTVGSYIGRAID